MVRSQYRWIIVALISIITFINYIDRSAVGYATVPIMKALHLNNAGFGIIGSAFSIGYLVLAFIGGPIVDRLGVKKTWLTAAGIWSIVTVLTSVAFSGISLFIIRVFLGVSEGPAFPAATRATSRWLPNSERGKALGYIVGLGVPFSLMLGGPIVTWLIGGVGWRGMFIILGIIGLLWVFVWAIMFKDLPREHKRVNEAEVAYIEAGQTIEERTSHLERTKWGQIFRNGNLWWAAIGYFAWGFMFWAFMFWLPGYLGQVYHLNLASVGAFSVIPWAAGTVGAFVGGFIADMLVKRNAGPRSRFVLTGIAILLAGASLIPIIITPSLGTAITFISIGIGFGMITGPLWWVMSIESEPQQPAAAAGFVDAAFALSGIVAPSVMGFTSQMTGSFSSGFIVMIVLALISGIGLVAMTRNHSKSRITSDSSAGTL